MILFCYGFLAGFISLYLLLYGFINGILKDWKNDIDWRDKEIDKQQQKINEWAELLKKCYEHDKENGR